MVAFPFRHGIVFFVSLLLVVCLFRCMIVFHYGLCTLISFGCVVVFLIPPWFISFNQLKELHFVACVVLQFFLLGIQLSFSFLCHLFHLLNQMNGVSLQSFNLFCFVLGDLLSSLFIQSSFCLSIPIDGQQVVVIVLLFHLSS